MFKIKGKHYYNDYTKENFEITFNSLEDIFKWCAEVSENFANERNNYFPYYNNNGRFIIDRISIKDEKHIGWVYWIYQIETENGIVFSTGNYTSGQTFCAERIIEWCTDCNSRAKALREKPKFIEI